MRWSLCFITVSLASWASASIFTAKPLEAGLRASMQSPQSNANLIAASKLWVKMGMPVPPPGSHPVCVMNERSGLRGVGFAYKTGNREELLYGTRVRARGQVKWVELEWTQEAALNSGSGDFDEDYGIPQDVTVCAAMESAAAGHLEFAKGLLARALPPGVEAWLGRPVGTRGMAALEIGRHLSNELLRPNSDRQRILSGYQQLAATGFLEEDHLRYFRYEWPLAQVIQELKATLTHPRTFDPFEALLDEAGSVAKAHVDRIVSLGPSAIPMLLRHFGDWRLTRTASVGSSIASLGELASWIAFRIADNDLGVTPRYPSASEVEAWHKAKLSGTVGRFLLDHTVEPSYRDAQRLWSSDSTFEAILYKYPDLLPDAYRRALDFKPHADCGRVITLLSQATDHDKTSGPSNQSYHESQLTGCLNWPQAKVESIWKIGATARDVRQREGPLQLLRYARSPAYVGLMIRSLDALPRDLMSLASPNLRDVSLANEATQCTNDEVWDALLRAVKRSSPEYRVELLWEVAATDRPSGNRRRQLRLLSQFFQDRGAPRTLFGRRNRLRTYQIALNLAATLLGKHPLPESASGGEWIRFRRMIEAIGRTG